MKHLKTYESYDLDNIQNWWSGIKTHEDDDYIHIDLSDVYLVNKRIQLNLGLKGKTVEFFCMNHQKKEKIKVGVVSYNEDTGDLIFSYEDPKHNKFPDYRMSHHYVNTLTPIKICKLENNVEKYNL